MAGRRATDAAPRTTFSVVSSSHSPPPPQRTRPPSPAKEARPPAWRNQVASAALVAVEILLVDLYAVWSAWQSVGIDLSKETLPFLGLAIGASLLSAVVLTVAGATILSVAAGAGLGSDKARVLLFVPHVLALLLGGLGGGPARWLGAGAAIVGIVLLLLPMRRDVRA